MSMKRMKHLLVLCLALVMVVGLLSVTALADGSMQVTFSQKGGAYYFPGDELTVTVTGLPSGYDSADVTLSHNGGNVLEAVGAPACGDTTYAQTYRVAKITGNHRSVKFDATYTSVEGPDTASGTIAMNLRNRLTVTLTDAGQPLSDATVVLHHAYGSPDITLQAQGSGTYVTGRTALSNDWYDYVSVTTADGRTATIDETTSGGSLMDAIRAGTDLVNASYAFDGYTVAGTLYVNGAGVSNWSTRYAGPYGETIDFDPMVDAAEEKALSVDADNDPVYAEATVYTPGPNGRPVTDGTYGGDGFNWQLINGKYITYFWVKATTYYNVSFDTDSGSNVATQEVAYNGTATEPEDPTRSGYKFLGWYTEGDEAFDFDTPITSSVTLHAKWQAETPVTPVEVPYYVYAYSERLDGSYHKTEDTYYAPVGEKVTAPVDVLRHYYLNEKKSTLDGTIVKIEDFDDFVVLKVYYDLIDYKITYTSDLLRPLRRRHAQVQGYSSAQGLQVRRLDALLEYHRLRLRHL